MAMDKDAYLKVISVMNAAYQNGEFSAKVHNEVLNALEEYHKHTSEEEEAPQIIDFLSKLSNEELFEKFYGTFGPPEITVLSAILDIDRIPGFTSIVNAIVKNFTFTKNVIKSNLKKLSKHGSNTTIEDYKKDKEKGEAGYKCVLLLDLYNNYNVDIIREIIAEEAYLNYLVEAEPEVEIVVDGDEIDSDKEISELKSEIASLNQKIKKHSKELVRQEEVLRKRLKEDFDKRLKTKISELEGKHTKEVISINARREELARENEKLSKEYETYKKDTNKKLQQYEIILKHKRIVLLSMKPVNDELFPYNYELATLKSFLNGELIDSCFSEVWVEKEQLDDLKINAIKIKARDYGNQCLVYEVESQKIKEFGLEVVL